MFWKCGVMPPHFHPTKELGAQHDVITPIWGETNRRTCKWSVLFCACLYRWDHSDKGRDLPLSTTDLWDYREIRSRQVETAVCVFVFLLLLYRCDFIDRLSSWSKNNLNDHTYKFTSTLEHQLKGSLRGGKEPISWYDTMLHNVW